MHAKRYPWARKTQFPVCLAAILLLWTATASANAPRESSDALLREYNAAIAQKQPADRISRLQQFAWTASGPLRADALEIVVWEYLRAGNNTRALTWANELSLADKGNALALAVICRDAQHSAQAGLKPDQIRKLANQGEAALSRLRHPTGMSEADFTALRRQASLMLDNAAGRSTSQQATHPVATPDYSTTKKNSHAIATSDSSNAASRSGTATSVNSKHVDMQAMYRQAVADLKHGNTNHRQAFWELARAVVLSGGSIQGHPITDEARKLYLKDGGTNAGWNQFLEAALAGNPALAPSARFAPSRTAAVASATAPAPPTKSKTQQTASVRPVTLSTKPGASPAKPRPSQGDQVWANGKMANPGIVRKTRVLTGPMSLGILIETSLTGKDRRAALGNTLVDMLRHMADDDEAFILTYDNDLVFEQDLTGDPKQLDEALQEIRPRNGAKLDEAVAFAAGHLARIAKNPNRILLVISDGRNVDSHTPVQQTSGMINAAGVRIYCIGVGVDKADGRSHLQALSAGTGGQSNFITDASQFRGATRQIAQNIGIDFRF